MPWCVHAERGFPPRNPRKCQLPRLTIFDTNRGKGAEWWVSVLFLSFPYSHRGWTKLTTSQFVRSQNIFTDRRCLRIKFTNRVPTIRIPDKSWKRLSSLSHMVWCSSAIFQVLERTKQTKSPWFKSRKDSVYVGGAAGFPCQNFCTNSSSLDLFTEKLLYRCHDPVECMNVEFARLQWSFLIHFQTLLTYAAVSGPESCWAVRNPSERSGSWKTGPASSQSEHALC